MRPSYHTTLISLLSITILALLSATLAIAPLIDAQEPPGQEQQQTGTSELQPVMVYFQKNNGLSPEALDDENVETSPCPNGFVRTGLFGFGVAPIGVQEWRDIGDWESSSLGRDLNIASSAEFQLYATSTSYDPMDFNVTVFVGDRPIGTGMAESVGIEGGQTNLVSIPVKFQGISAISSGQTIRIHLQSRYAGSDDGSICSIQYGSKEAPTGLKLTSDAINILDASACHKSVKLQYTEAFRVPNSLLNTEAKVDNIRIEENPDFSVEEGTNIAEWEKGVSAGTHAIEISISYGEGNTSWMITKNVNVAEPPTAGFVGALMNWLWLIIVAAVAVVVLIVIFVVRGRKAEEEFDDDYDEYDEGAGYEDAYAVDEYDEDYGYDHAEPDYAYDDENDPYGYAVKEEPVPKRRRRVRRSRSSY